MVELLSLYVGLGIPAMLGTLLVLNRALDFYERLQRKRARTVRARKPFEYGRPTVSRGSSTGS
jgi:hypothetical protein